MNMKDKKVYIYNPYQASYYMRNGIRCLDTGIGRKNHDIYYVFSFNDTIDVYEKWANYKLWYVKNGTNQFYNIYKYI